MKFDKPKVHRQWTSEETQARITLVNSEISSFCRDLNLLDREMNTLRHKKESIQKKISNKVKYVNQLENQLDEIRINNAEDFLFEKFLSGGLLEANSDTEPDIADEQGEPDETMGNLFDFSSGSFLPGPYTHSLVWTPFTSSYEEFVISGSGLPNNIPVDELSFEEQEKMLIEYRDATEPDIADDLRGAPRGWRDSFGTDSWVWAPYVPLLVTPPIISGSSLPSDIPVDEKDWDSEPDIADELRPWSASSSLSPYFRVVQPKYPNLIPIDPSEFSNKFGSLTTNDGFVPTTPKYFEGDVNPTGSNSFGFNVQPLKLESSDIKPEIELKSTITNVDKVSDSKSFFRSWFRK